MGPLLSQNSFCIATALLPISHQSCSTLCESLCALDVLINGWNENAGYL